MSTRLVTATALSLVLALAAGGAFLFVELRDARRRAEDLAMREAKLQRLLEERDESLRRLRQELAAEKDRGRSLAERVERAEDALTGLAEAKRSTALEDDAKASRATSKTREPYVLESIDAADALAQSYLDRGDLEGIWLLAADLLALGEPGYDKLVELFALLEDKRFEGLMKGLWSDEEALAGSFLKVVGAHAGEILDFALHVDGLEQERLTKSLHDLSGEIIEDELGGILLGYCDDLDPRIQADYFRALEKRVAQRPSDRDLIRNLSQIPTVGATDLLSSLWERADKRARQAIVQGIAWQRTERALPALRGFLGSESEPEIRETIEAAIRFLE